MVNTLMLCMAFCVVCSCGEDENEPMDDEVVLPPENNEDGDSPSDDDFLDVLLPELSDVDVLEVDFYGTTISAFIYSDGGDKIIECGFCFSSTSQEPTINDQKILVESDSYKISALMPEFTEVTTYYVRAYAINSKGIAYSSSAASFIPNVIGGYEFVDLGLSVKWATCDVGADNPEEEGDIYAWGETSVKSEYTLSNYSHKNRVNYMGSYVYTYSLSIPISGTKYDVAYQKWGTRWCMPTPDDFEELIDKCTWTSTTQNGVEGYLVTGPNGNSIFLHNGDYWADDNILTGLYGASNSQACYLNVYTYGYSSERKHAHLGSNVRPVAR